MIPAGSYVVVESISDGRMQPPPEGVQVTIEFDGDRVAGSAGCNRFTGTLNPDGSIASLVTTMMACPPPIMEFEQQLLGLLGRVIGFRVSDSDVCLVEGDIDLVRLAHD